MSHRQKFRLGAIALVLFVGAALLAAHAWRQWRRADALAKKLAHTKTGVIGSWGPHPRDIVEEALARALSRATVSSLRRPQIAIAVVLNGQRNHNLVVYWLEDEPTVDAVEITTPGGEVLGRLAVPAEYQKQNVASGSEYVLFYAMLPLSSEIFEQATGGHREDLRITLLRLGQRASDPGHVELWTPPHDPTQPATGPRANPGTVAP